ncbi:MAG: universal stress protein [Hamadaea sp.]|uniref:universal stress protein n=1 Tax=Hamadaea sp. TaxID=2024425 RepID=UPI0018405969|nr:universal stress protein [Hamadaea sp.]NUR71755.1 universal stress protein [Hamadaea sp.]NUT19069.1 universal stress protein [Hamadaea sp.]
MDAKPPVVVGVDGSPAAMEAARWAAAYAVRHGASLRCVYGYHLPLYGYSPIGSLGEMENFDARARRNAEDMLATTADRLRAAYAGLEIDTQLEIGGGTAVLVEASREAIATVVGARGDGGFTHLLLGSVADQVTVHGLGPIIVVRGPAPDRGPVLVGVDASDHAARALRYAAAEAALRNTDLVVLNAYTETLHPRTADAAAEGKAEAERLLADVTADLPGLHPRLHIELRPVYTGRTDQAMIEASAGAVLTVVGCRGLGGLRSLLLGSTSRALTHHAAGPVAVVHRNA